MHTKTWHVDVYIDEDEETTYARAVLTGDAPRPVESTGTARRNPADRDVPEIGDELATARALSAMSQNLIDLAVRDIEDFEGRPVHLVR